MDNKTARQDLETVIRVEDLALGSMRKLRRIQDFLRAEQAEADSHKPHSSIHQIVQMVVDEAQKSGSVPDRYPVEIQIWKGPGQTPLPGWHTVARFTVGEFRIVNLWTDTFFKGPGSQPLEPQKLPCKYHGDDNEACKTYSGKAPCMRSNEFTLEFHPNREAPAPEDEDRDFLLYNPCDGFHEVKAHFDGAEFEGFAPFAGDILPKDFYTAWAKLPEYWDLHELFPPTVLETLGYE